MPTVMRRATLALGAACLFVHSIGAQSSSLHITSPLGRTGAVLRVRIVAQIILAPGATLSPVEIGRAHV